MALGTILVLVKENLPFLSDGTHDTKIESQRIQVMYWLQSYLKKSDADVENESTYKPLERILISWLIGYNLLNTKAIEIAGGNSSTSTEPETTFLKEAKADVVDAQFDQIDRNKAITLAQSAEEIMATCLKQACAIARTLKINLGICGMYKYDMIKPFTIIR